MKGIYSVLVENRAGVLAEIARLFARRNFNIESLAVGETDRHDTSSMTIVSSGDQRTLDQIEKHLNKRIDVIKVRRLEERDALSLEMMLIKVAYSVSTRSQIMEICSIMGASILHLSPWHMVIELHAAHEKIESFIDLVRPFGILEVQRTGTISMSRK